MSRSDPSRLQAGEPGVGYTEAVERHANRHVVAPKPVSQRKLDFENARPRWMREMAAEAMGVFFFVYPGIASCASFFLNPGDPGLGSIFQIGWAFAIGIAFAIITCGSTFGGHFNAAVTIPCAVWLGFPWRKVPQYIFAQVFGSFIAAMLLVGQYYPQLQALAAEYHVKGLSLNSPGGPGSVLCSFPGPNQSYGYLFFIEFFPDVYVGIVIWACLDPMNPFVSAAAVPWVIGIGYGARIVAAIFFGGDAFSIYSAIPVFTSIRAMLFGTALYETIQRDSFGVIAKGHNIHEKGEEGVLQHLSKNGALSGSTSTSGRSIDSGKWENGRKNDSAV